MYRLVGQDCAVQITDGGAWDGTPNWGVASDVKALARSVRVQESVSLHDVTSLGDTRRKKRPQTGEGRAEVELYVSSAGVVSIAVGRYCKVEVKELSSLGSYLTYTGILVENSVDVPDNPQIQRLVVDCDAEVA